MTPATIIGIVVIAIIFLVIVIHAVRNLIKGKHSCSCGGNCGACGMNCQGHSKKSK